MWFSSSAGVSTSLSSMKSTSSACSTSASAKWPMRTLAITGIVTVAMISRITLTDAMRATPPSLRMSEGTRSSAITAHAPAFSAILACSGMVTSIITPPLSISARPTFTCHSVDAFVPLPLPFGFFASIVLLLSVLNFFVRPIIGGVAHRISFTGACAPRTALSSDQRHAAALRPSHSALPFAHFDFQQFRERCHAARNLLFIQACKAQSQRVWQRRLHVEISSGSKQHAAFFHVNQQFAGLESQRQFQPQAHTAFRLGPARSFRHVFAQSFIQRCQTRSVDLAHFGKVFAEKPAPQKLREGSLGKLIGMKIGRLLDHAQSFNRGWRSDNPSDTQTGKGHFCKAVDVNDQVRTVELFE